MTDAKVTSITTAGKIANSATTANTGAVNNTIALRTSTGGINASLLTLTGNFISSITDIDGAGRLAYNPSSASLAVGATTAIANAPYSYAFGQRASASNGSFAFGDASGGTTLPSTGNQFAVRATGGVRLFSAFNLSTYLQLASSTLTSLTTGGVQFYSSADSTAGVTLAAGSGSWASVSNVRAKTDFLREDPERWLRGIQGMNLQTWRYKTQAPAIRHVGPTAQEFYAAFGLGGNDTTITAVDADGASMLAIQALAKRTESLLAENAALKKRLDDQERRMAAFEAMLRRSAPMPDSSAKRPERRD